MAGHLAIFDGVFFAIFRHCGEVDLSEQRNLSSLSAEIRMMELEKEGFFAADCKSYDLLEFQAPYYIIRDVIPLLPATFSLMDFIDVLQYRTLKKSSPTLEKRKNGRKLIHKINELHFPFSF